MVFSDVFDSMGMAANGIIIDPEYIQKRVFIPFNAERPDTGGSGQRNTEALVRHRGELPDAPLSGGARE